MGDKKAARQAHDLYIDAICRRVEQGWNAPKVRRGVQESFRRLLESGEPLPPEMACELALAFDELRRGKQPALFQPIGKAGNRPSAAVSRYQADAANYIHFRLRDLTEGSRPYRSARAAAVAEVAGCFGVSIASVYQWLRANGPTLTKWPPERLVVAIMKASGRRYQAESGHSRKGAK